MQSTNFNRSKFSSLPPRRHSAKTKPLPLVPNIERHLANEDNPITGSEATFCICNNSIAKFFRDIAIFFQTTPQVQVKSKILQKRITKTINSCGTQENELPLLIFINILFLRIFCHSSETILIKTLTN